MIATPFNRQTVRPRLWLAMWILLSLVGRGGAADPSQRESSPSLHIIVFQDLGDTPAPLSTESVRTLPNADLPEVLSKGMLLPPDSVCPGLADCDLPSKVRVLDIKTLVLPSRRSGEPIRLKHSNRFAKLSYALELRDGTENSCRFKLRGDFEKRSFAPQSGHLSKQATSEDGHPVAAQVTIEVTAQAF